MLMAYWLSVIEMNLMTCVQTLDKAVGILRGANTLGKGLNPTIFSPFIVTYEGRLGFLTLI